MERKIEMIAGVLQDYYEIVEEGTDGVEDEYWVNHSGSQLGFLNRIENPIFQKKYHFCFLEFQFRQEEWSGLFFQSIWTHTF